MLSTSRSHNQHARSMHRGTGKRPPMFVWFHADWCGNCTAMKDEWKAAVQHITQNQVPVIMAAVSDKHLKPEWASLFGVEGFPTMVHIHQNHGGRGQGFHFQKFDERDRSRLIRHIVRQVSA